MCNVCVACKKLLLIENESCQYSKTVSKMNTKILLVLLILVKKGKNYLETLKR